ncbi:uncharacterized protein LOC143465135 [Clavelina lepadiformis]|uniref:uncharacterized protein LOC143465135 n=1 Tax=Clavelina lepadiformis TaxID=159417 RepID=UPI004042B7A0
MEQGDGLNSNSLQTSKGSPSDASNIPLVTSVNPSSPRSKQHHKGKKKHSTLIIPVLPPTPEDCCLCCDPVCHNHLRLAVLTTFCCWMLLGFLPIIFGFISIYYARKARMTKDELQRERYNSLSWTISWAGMLLFTIGLILAVLLTATCGVL